MKEQLKALLQLAEVDNEINSLREIKEARPKQLEPFRAGAQRRAEKVKLVKDELRRLRLAGDVAEREIKEKEEKIRKVQVQLNTAKSNEEFQVLKEQQARLREELSKLEETGLASLGKTEQLGEELKRVEQESTEALEELEAAERETADEIHQIDKRLGELTAAREEAKQGVESKYLAQYERVLERHHDRVVVPVENGTCQGCYMSVTPQMINTLIIGKEIVLCKNCQRILYLAE
jgi:hypothetical protein